MKYRDGFDWNFPTICFVIEMAQSHRAVGFLIGEFDLLASHYEYSRYHHLRWLQCLFMV